MFVDVFLGVFTRTVGMWDVGWRFLGCCVGGLVNRRLDRVVCCSGFEDDTSVCASSVSGFRTG